MRWHNTKNSYGVAARLFHWVTAAVVIGMFALGLWMRQLSYYDPWYKLGPEWHKSVGLTLLVLIVLRLVWRRRSIQPEELSPRLWERLAARAAHVLLYALLILTCVAGYFISTADGSAITVFWAFDVPALIERQGMEDLAGLIHEYLAYSLIALAASHALAAFKHHLIDKDATLRRMVSGRAVATPVKTDSD